MKKLLILFTLCLAIIGAQAATKDPAARKILDATANHLNGAGGIKAAFTASSLQGKKIVGTTRGTILLKGKKFQLTTAEMLTWFDGKTQWSMQPGDSEVAMQEPTAQEQQAMNPYAFINIYKKGFNYKKREGKMINGKQGYKVTLTAENKKQRVQEIYLEIDKQYNPVRISIREGKNQWTRLVISSIQTGLKFADSQFVFPSKDYPKAEIIDLR